MTTTSRVLVFAEAVTLAHVARPIALASSLKGEFDVRFACAARYREFFEPGSRDQLLELDSITSSEFLSRLATGRPVYDAVTLRRYVDEDLRLIGQIKPAVVVGDFRLSLSVSARRAGVPYVALANAYWSPYARPQFELPSHPSTRVFGRRLAAAVFRIVQPIAFAYHAMPMNRVRRQFGLPSLGVDLRRVYTDADYIAYADIPELIPTYGLPERHSYIGPVLWSTPSPLPPWWESLPRERPVIFVTMGSSGDASVLPLIIQALAGLPATVVVASVGAKLPQGLPPNVHTAPYLPADVAARRARLVVCNGGSPTTHHALAAGVPVLGITTNMDQFLNMQYLAACGVGLRSRADELNGSDVRRLAARLLDEKPFADAANAMSAKMASYNAPDRFAAIVRRALQRN